ncbi:MAG: cobyric acid synthase CobQ, partial [Heliobacteriaceae bacterium]|nr:cobyric acid synthase CobQ [Heliobacteriaceae bacterium]
IINKFRGDQALLQPALDFIEDYTGKPVLGVVPYFRDLQIQEEDSVALEKANIRVPAGELLDIVVIRLPRMANFADFAALTAEGAAQVRYVENLGQLGKPDLVILPGTENIRADLRWLRQAGLDRGIGQLADQGRLVWGIAGGYALLGGQIRDEAAGENPEVVIAGLGLLDVVTVLEMGTATWPVTAEICGEGPFLGPLRGLPVEGYIIGQGQNVVKDKAGCFCFIRQQGDKPVNRPDGAVGRNGLVIGSALYGVFDNDRLRHRVFNFLRARRGWPPVSFPVGESLTDRRDQDYNRLAAVVRESLRMDLLYALIGGKRD